MPPGIFSLPESPAAQLAQADYRALAALAAALTAFLGRALKKTVVALGAVRL